LEVLAKVLQTPQNAAHLPVIGLPDFLSFNSSFRLSFRLSVLVAV